MISIAVHVVRRLGRRLPPHKLERDASGPAVLEPAGARLDSAAAVLSLPSWAIQPGSGQPAAIHYFTSS